MLNPSPDIFIGCDFADPNSTDRSVYTVMRKREDGVIEILESGDVKFSEFIQEREKQHKQFIERIQEKYKGMKYFSEITGKFETL